MQPRWPVYHEGGFFDIIYLLFAISLLCLQKEVSWPQYSTTCPGDFLLSLQTYWSMSLLLCSLMSFSLPGFRTKTAASANSFIFSKSAWATCGNNGISIRLLCTEWCNQQPAPMTFNLHFMQQFSMLLYQEWLQLVYRPFRNFSKIRNESSYTSWSHSL